MLFSDINILQGNVVTQLRFGGIFDDHFTANLLLRMPVQQF